MEAALFTHPSESSFTVEADEIRGFMRLDLANSCSKELTGKNDFDFLPNIETVQVIGIDVETGQRFVVDFCE
jgi:hypothetical protein